MQNSPGQSKVFLCGYLKQVPDHCGVMSTGTGTGLKDLADVQEQDLGIFVCNGIDHQSFTGNTGVGFRKDFSGPNVDQNASVAPDIVIFNGNAAGKNQSYAICRFSCSEMDCPMESNASVT